MTGNGGRKHSSQRELAEALGVSQPQVCRLRREGMPADVAGAKAWRAANLEWGRTKGVRMPGGYDAALEQVERCGAALGEAPEAAAIEFLRAAFLALPEATQQRVLLPESTWALLCGLGTERGTP